MPVKIALDSFLAVAKRSNLLTAEQLKTQRDAFESGGGQANDAHSFAEFLVKRKVLTAWQADKLLQGKHKGFFLGKYKLLSLLGKGGMSSVYLAEHVLMRRRCAIKVLPTKRVHDTSYLGRFHREAQAVAALDDPNIVRAYDVDHEEDGDMEIHFLVMEHVDGKSLLELVQDNGPSSSVETADFIRQAASGLEHAHQAGLVHRDIKPGNLLVDSTGVVKLLDLGLARFFAGSEDVALTIQHDEKVLGTADYLAPEQAVDSHRVDARADIYSLGCTMYFLLTGHPPFTEGTLTQRLLAHQTKEPAGVAAERNDVPESLLAILKRMMAKQPDERYQSCEEVANEMAGWLRANGGGDRVPGSDTGSGNRKRESVADTSSAADKGADTGKPPAASKSPAAEPKEKPPAVTSPTPPPEDEPEPELGAFLAQLGGGSPDDTVEQPVKPVKPVEPDKPVKPVKAPAQPTSKKPKEKPVAESPPVRDKKKPAPRKEPVPVSRDAEETETVVQAEPVVEAIPVAESTDDEAPTIVTTPAESIETAEPATEVEVKAPAAEAVAIAEPGPTIQTRRRRKSGNNGLLIGGAFAVAAVLVIVIGYVVSQNGSGPGEDPITPPEEFQGENGGPGPVSPQPPEDLGPEIRVGGEGDFTTISDAIAYVESHADRFGPDSPWVILVTGGAVYDERLVIESSSFGGFPERTRIASDGDSRAVLRPSTGEGPVIDLINTEEITIEGFQIDAGGGEVAVRMSRYLLNARLENLEIVNFTEAGILSDGATGLQGRPVRMSNLTLRATNNVAVGMHLEDMREAQVTGCRFVGPMRAGMELTTSGRTTNVRIERCRFHELQAGVLFTGPQLDLQGIAFINNTFHRIQRGVVFSQMPQAGSSGFEFRQNLFSGIDGVEAVIEQGYDAERAARLLVPADAVNNWSERAGDAPVDGELDLFATDGRRGIDAVPFDSRDPAAVNFLRPTEPATRNAVGAVR